MKRRDWQGFGEYVLDLLQSRNVFNKQSSKSNTFTYIVMISRKMLHFGMKRWIGCEKNRGEVVTVELRSNRKWNPKLFENMTNPSDFRSGFRERPVLSLR
uniref:Uncharacterized protein n=1 Tax=Brassica oleracea var. oleracea TaxID=109376 RepID=A0A0D3E5K2_BRAOL